jgi:hypothetical protein
MVRHRRAPTLTTPTFPHLTPTPVSSAEEFLNKTLLLRKIGSQFIETIATEGKHAAVRSYDNWDKVAVRLLQLGVPPDEISRIESAFDSGEEQVNFVGLG